MNDGGVADAGDCEAEGVLVVIVRRDDHLRRAQALRGRFKGNAQRGAAASSNSIGRCRANGEVLGVRTGDVHSAEGEIERT